MLITNEYKGLKIFSYENFYVELGKKIIDKNYKSINILKDTKRNYVAEIMIDNKNYIFKEPKNEYIIPQRKVLSLLKKGEALTTLINVNHLIEKEKIKGFARPLLAIVKRKKGMIIYSALVLEKIESNNKRELDKMVEVMKKVHEAGYYHGDCNPSNFISSKNGMKILDSQGKKMWFGNYRAHYDMLTMKLDSYQEMKYTYKKNFFYYLALSLKKIKRLKFIKKIKEKKSLLREKGWKI